MAGRVECPERAAPALRSRRVEGQSLMAGPARKNPRPLLRDRGRCHRRLSVFCTYILRCADGALYIGHTSNLDLRVQRHNEGRGPLFTRSRTPVRVAYSETHPTEADAIARERQMKRWTLLRKEALIAGDLALLKRL